MSVFVSFKIAFLMKFRKSGELRDEIVIKIKQRSLKHKFWIDGRSFFLFFSWKISDSGFFVARNELAGANGQA